MQRAALIARRNIRGRALFSSLRASSGAGRQQHHSHSGGCTCCRCASSTRYFSTEAAPAETETETPAWAVSESPPSPKVLELADAIAGLTLSECSALSLVLKDKLGLSDIDLVSAAPAGAGAPGGAEDGGEAAAEKTAFDIKLEGFDAKAKIKVIKEVRALCGLGLKEAKEMVEAAPKTILKDVGKKDAEEMLEKLTELGAKVSMV